MRRGIARALIAVTSVAALAAMALGAAGEAAAAPATGFSDVSASNAYYTSILALASQGIIEGYSDGTFHAGDLVTRQQLAKVLVKALGIPVTGDETCPFVDVTKGSAQASDPFYPDQYIAVVYANGLMQPKNPTQFGPLDDVSLTELIVAAARAAGLSDPPAGYNPVFGPSSTSEYDWIRRAAYAGFLDGLEGMGPDFDFSRSASRAESAQVLNNLLMSLHAQAGSTTLTTGGASGSTGTPGSTATPGSDTTSGSTVAPTVTSVEGSVSATTGGTQLAASGGDATPMGPSLTGVYVIVGVCFGILLLLTATIRWVRRPRSIPVGGAGWVQPGRQPGTRLDADALLHEWGLEGAELPVVACHSEDSQREQLWEELTRSAAEAESTEGLVPDRPEPRGSDAHPAS